MYSHITKAFICIVFSCGFVDQLLDLIQLMDVDLNVKRPLKLGVCEGFSDLACSLAVLVKYPELPLNILF